MKANSLSNEEIKLVKSLHHGDVFAFNTLFHKYSQKLYNFSLKHMDNEEDVKDLVQDVFITIWNRRKDIDEKQSFNGYLFAITLNAIRKHYRKKVQNRKLVEKWLGKEMSLSDITNQTVDYDSLKERVDKIIESMPQKRKRVFLLSREKGLPAEKIASEMNISKKTVENHLNLALNFLREKKITENLLLALFIELFY